MTALPQPPQPSADPAAQPPAQPPAADTGSPVVTQDLLSRLLAREKSQGERTATRKLVETLGFADTAALTTWVEAQRTAEQAAMTEVQRREQAADQREQAAQQREQAAEARLRAAVRHSALVRLGATGDDLEDAVRLLVVADDADDQAVKDAAAALKARRPELFRVAVPAGGPPAPGGAPAGGPPPRGQAPTASSAGLDMAKRRGYVT